MGKITVRTARPEELPLLGELVARSFRALGAGHYSPAEIEGALQHRLIRVDPGLVEAGTYFVAEDDGVPAGCGGWSVALPTVPSLPLPPGHAEVRAMFVLPEHANKGLGRALLHAAERAIAAAGHDRAYLVATASGAGFYRACGYQPIWDDAVPIPGGGALKVTAMLREIATAKTDS